MVIGMNINRLAGGIAFLALLLGPSVSGTATAPISKEQAVNLERKIDEIASNGASDPVRPKKTVISDPEVASYLAFNGKGKIPHGLTQPQISMLGSGNVAGRVLVDIDEFKRQRASAGFMDPLTYISGQVPLTARGILRTRNGKGEFQLGSAEIYTVPVPKPLLQELVSFFSRTPNNPTGFNLDEPFDLPAKIREVVVNRGEALIVQ